MAAEFAEHTTIEDAIDAASRGLVRKASEEEREVEYYSIDDLIKAAQYGAGRTAAAKPHFGLRFTKLIPPGTQ